MQRLELRIQDSVEQSVVRGLCARCPTSTIIRKRARIAVVLVLLSVSLGGCVTRNVAGGSVQTAPPERLRGSPGGRFAAQVIESQPGLVECGSLACLRDAFQECRPAHHHASGYSAEGTPVYVDTFVLRDGDQCSVVSYADYTQDYWGRCAVIRRACASVDAVLDTMTKRDDCRPSEQLYKTEKCEYPYKDEVGH